MKLIIDIPNHLYNVIKNKECTNKNVLTKAVENGIPLDDVKAEIGQGYCMPSNEYDKGRNYGLYMAKQILDNIGKAESEVSE